MALKFSYDFLHQKNLHVTIDDVAELLNPKIPKFAKLLIIAGTVRYRSAAEYAALAAMRAGVHGVTLATVKDVADAISTYQVPVAMRILSDYSPKEMQVLMYDLPKYDAVLIGPGLTKYENNGVVEFLTKYKSNKPIIIDGNAIEAIASKPILIKRIPNDILTTNYKEFQGFTNRTIPMGLKSRIRLVTRMAKKYAVTILLKGPGDIVSDGRNVKVNLAGVPAMAASNAGDVIAGLTAGFAALGNKPFASAAAALYVFTRAGDAVFTKEGYSMLPVDILDKLPDIIGEIYAYQSMNNIRSVKPYKKIYRKRTFAKRHA